MLYRRRPTLISAEQWYPEHGLKPGMLALPEHHVQLLPRYDGVTGAAAMIQGQAGYHAVKPGDYICRGAAGELYPVPPEIFRCNYEIADDQPRKPFDKSAVESGIANEVKDAINRA